MPVTITFTQHGEEHETVFDTLEQADSFATYLTKHCGVHSVTISSPP